ncbi:MAG: hypothetical protein MNPFHGCM_02449 [Gemmatimonadaceae bacterium]|nr:hypothetical protein [Gemmatimonadaceae bacterium]
MRFLHTSSRLVPALVLVVAAARDAFAQARRVAPAPSAQIDPGWLSQLRYRFIGPDGNRVIAVAGVAGDWRTYYAGAASGGIWKSTDGGYNWEAVGDSLDVQSIGSLAVAPSDRNIVWAGTGETFIRSNISIGNGIFRSTDAGGSWRRMGLENTGRIGRIVIDPRDPDIVFAAALGHSYGPQQDRGIYRTRDGGKTWVRVLFAGDSVGGIDLAMDPSNPSILFAAMWQVTIYPWSIESGGTGSGIWVSRDGGDTWKRLDGGPDRRGEGRGLPTSERVGKIAVAVAASDGSRVYALIEKTHPGFFRSDDGGRSWREVNQDHDLLERPRYYTRFAVAPDDENRIYFMGVRHITSFDGGTTKATAGVRGGCGDCHDIWIDPADAQRIILADDGGISISVDRGKSWRRGVLPNAQMYHVWADNRVPYYVYGNRQDGYSYRGPSNSREERSLSHWQAIGGCESGWAVPDTIDNRTVWSGCYDAGLEVTDVETRMSRAVEPWPEAGYGVPPKQLKYRFQWTFPITISPHDHNTVYVGSQFVHKTSNGGQSWTIISPDLTTNDTLTQGNSGGVVVDNLFVENSNVVFSIAESPLEKGLIWAGTMDGLLHLTRDGGANWSNLTANVPGLPRLSNIIAIEPSKYDAGTAYIAIDGHQVNDRDPYIYKTADYGKTWKRLTDGANGIPKTVFSYVHVVREDPVRRGMLYAGTENGLYFSLDDGAHWHPLQNNLPHAPVSWLQVQGTFHDLVVSTYGRGFYILDDITPLRELNESLLAKRTALLPIRAAYRFRRLQPTKQVGTLVDGDDPRYGADINVWVRTGTDSAGRAAGGRNPMRDTMLVIVQDPAGVVIRRFGAPPPRDGINRLWWDLRYDPPRTPRLRTTPPGIDYVRIPSGGWRPLVPWDLDLFGGLAGPLAPPGTYTIAVVVAGDTLRGSVEVRKDPNAAGTADDIRQQVALSLDLRGKVNATTDLIDEAEWIRRQLADASTLFTERRRQTRFAGAPGDSARQAAVADSVLRMVKSLEDKVLAIEGKLYDVNLTGAREDAFRNPNQLYERFLSLASDVGASSADFRPTDQHREVGAALTKQLTEYRAAFDRLLADDVAAYNRMATALGAPTLSIKPPIPSAIQ